MTIVVLKYTLMIANSIRQARQQRAITQSEAEYLSAMSEESYPAASTRALIGAQGVPDFLYAALYFSTMIWHSGEAAGDDKEARAGYKLARFSLSQESPEHDSFWAAKLLRDFYEAHEESTQKAVA
jgi:hypothetical protein